MELYTSLGRGLFHNPTDVIEFIQRPRRHGEQADIRKFAEAFVELGLAQRDLSGCLAIRRPDTEAAASAVIGVGLASDRLLVDVAIGP